MEYNEELFDQIEAYLKGKLPPAEAARLEQDMEADPALRDLVAMHRFEQEGLEYLVEEDLRKNMAAWEQPPRNSGPNGKWWLLLLLLPAGLILYFWLAPQPPAPAPGTTPEPPSLQQPQDQPGKLPEQTTPPPDEERPMASEEKTKPAPPEKPTGQPTNTNRYLAFAQEAYDLPPNLSTGLKSAGQDTAQNVLTPGIEAFSAGQFDKAIRLFAQVSADENPAVYRLAREYLAHAYFNKGQYAKAANTFREIAAQSTMAPLDRAEWYLLLSLLPDYPATKNEVGKLLGKMTDPAQYHSYAKRAEQMRQDLGI